MIRLDIFADPTCPWCYIGKAHLDRALEARPDHPFEVEWHPFLLNLGMPPQGMDRIEYLEAKFGGANGVLKSYGPVVEAAEAAGIVMNLPAIERTPNTIDAHRLIYWAGLQGKQTLMLSALMRAYFREGKDIGQPEVLTDIAAALDMERAVVARLLATDADRDLILSRDAHARERGVNAVPTYIVGQVHVVSGAQPSQFWTNAIEDLCGTSQ
jgi:predicted DsbA family dithiol-disulfide isomerase